MVSKVKLSSLFKSPRQIAAASILETQLNEFLQENCKSDWLCKGGKINEANGLLELMIQRGLKPDTFTYNALIDGYCVAGRIDAARENFVYMYSKGVNIM